MQRARENSLYLRANCQQYHHHQWRRGRLKGHVNRQRACWETTFKYSKKKPKKQSLFTETESSLAAEIMSLWSLKDTHTHLSGFYEKKTTSD